MHVAYTVLSRLHLCVRICVYQLYICIRYLYCICAIIKDMYIYICTGLHTCTSVCHGLPATCFVQRRVVGCLACTYVYMYMYIYIYCMHMYNTHYIRTRGHNNHIYIYIFTALTVDRTCMHICLYIYVNSYMCMYIYIYVYVCVFITYVYAKSVGEVNELLLMMALPRAVRVPLHACSLLLHSQMNICIYMYEYIHVYISNI